MALPDPALPLRFICDASDFTIGSAYLKDNADGHERVVAYDSRHHKPQRRNIIVMIKWYLQ